MWQTTPIMNKVNTEASMAVNGYFSLVELKLHNSHNVSDASHCTKAVVLPAIVVEENYQQQENHPTVSTHLGHSRQSINKLQHKFTSNELIHSFRLIFKTKPHNM